MHYLEKKIEKRWYVLYSRVEYCYSTLLSLMIGFHNFGAGIFQPKLTGMIMLFVIYALPPLGQASIISLYSLLFQSYITKTSCF